MSAEAIEATTPSTPEQPPVAEAEAESPVKGKPLTEAQQSIIAIVTAAEPIKGPDIFNHPSFGAVRETPDQFSRAMQGLTRRKLVRLTPKGYVLRKKRKARPEKVAKPKPKRGRGKLVKPPKIKPRLLYPKKPTLHRRPANDDVVMHVQPSPTNVSEGPPPDLGIEIAPGSQFAFVIRGVRVQVSALAVK